jgi:hypothetical protein
VRLDRGLLVRMMKYVHLMVVKVVIKVSTLRRRIILQGRSGREF